MQQHQFHPGQTLPQRNDNGTFKTTYCVSYPKMPTYEVSPVYNQKDDGQQLEQHGFPYDLSPYPNARYSRPGRPYQPMTFAEEDERALLQREKEYRKHMQETDGVPWGDEYREPKFRHNYDEELDYSPRGRARDRKPEAPAQMRGDRGQAPRGPYDDLLVDGQSTDPRDLRPAFCQNPQCFEDKKCLNRLGCDHRFCDNCTSSMRGTDGPFRDIIVWHFQCPLNHCRKMTPGPKLIRLDPFGRRMLKFHDIGYFKTT